MANDSVARIVVHYETERESGCVEIPIKPNEVLAKLEAIAYGYSLGRVIPQLNEEFAQSIPMISAGFYVGDEQIGKTLLPNYRFEKRSKLEAKLSLDATQSPLKKILETYPSCKLFFQQSLGDYVPHDPSSMMIIHEAQLEL